VCRLGVGRRNDVLPFMGGQGVFKSRLELGCQTGWPEWGGRACARAKRNCVPHSKAFGGTPNAAVETTALPKLLDFRGSIEHGWNSKTWRARAPAITREGACATHARACRVRNVRVKRGFGLFPSFLPARFGIFCVR
jgi:hypothetical protein